jgi:hypothetical protein
MAASNLVVPEKTNDTEGYEEPINVVSDGLAAGGFYPQSSSPGDLLAGIERDALGNLVLKDTFAGMKTLSDLISAISFDPDKMLLETNGSLVYIDDGIILMKS